MTTALITGITGQTGSYLCEQLLAAGVRVHGLVRDADDLEPSFRERSPQALLHTGDLASADGLRRLVDEVEPDTIYNLGGLTSVAASWDDPDAVGLINGLRVGTLLQAARDLGRRRGEPVAVVQASTAEMFGNAAQVPQTESTPIAPVNPYGAAKAYAHHLVGVYRAAGVPASSCILYNHESPRRPVTFVTRKITRGVARIAAGLDDALVLGNLDAERDWGWAPDYADALVRAAGHPGDYIIATGERHTVRDFVGAAFAAVGIAEWSGLVVQDPRFMRPQDAPTQLGDARRAREVLGWEPRVRFDEIVRRMVENDVALIAAQAD
ncbi:GDP-mannose 4,6-dehydratase [Galbitalea soli]|uniref:GDP-mannose 4,6-dehydratase n=1 Tax=Galbitalea soli TaxID=1268042 RepID=A0A7C9TR32_9MICO|nr:GDP-mannose 4,6-dehydratase [Galbitalea soli]NYJ30031.1 GDPmannose 4,6-dehydratase [Galbitalea soli]